MHSRGGEAVVIEVDLVTHQPAKGYKMLLESGKTVSKAAVSFQVYPSQARVPALYIQPEDRETFTFGRMSKSARTLYVEIKF